MEPNEVVVIRKSAEQAVADMEDGPLKIAAFEVILGSMLQRPVFLPRNTTDAPKELSGPGETPTTLAGRVSLLAGENFFSEPRSLAEIQAALSQHGWFYSQENLSTPLVRLVRQRQLRRLQMLSGRKKIWKYSVS